MPAGTGCMSDGSARHARAGKRRSRTFRGSGAPCRAAHAGVGLGRHIADHHLHVVWPVHSGRSSSSRNLHIHSDSLSRLALLIPNTNTVIPISQTHSPTVQHGKLTAHLGDGLLPLSGGHQARCVHVQCRPRRQQEGLGDGCVGGHATEFDEREG